MGTFKFKAELEIIGVNPFVFVPETILQKIFNAAGKDKGPIPVSGSINGDSYRQTLVRFKGEWRLYINTAMLRNSPKRIGETIIVTIAYDSADRTIPMHAEFEKRLKKNKGAMNVFMALPPSRQKEIVRYISSLKSSESVSRNIGLAIGFLTGKNRFVGRDKP